MLAKANVSHLSFRLGGLDQVHLGLGDVGCHLNAESSRQLCPKAVGPSDPADSASQQVPVSLFPTYMLYIRCQMTSLEAHRQGAQPTPASMCGTSCLPRTASPRLEPACAYRVALSSSSGLSVEPCSYRHAIPLVFPSFPTSRHHSVTPSIVNSQPYLLADVLFRCYGNTPKTHKIMLSRPVYR